jgi:ATP-dependent Clp protease ATP-binding subunit ClpB
VSRLIGAPPGYVGYEEGGQLTEAVRRKPYSVVLLDEIEKAHPEVFNLLLQLLDEGRLTDSKGRTVDFKNTIVIMTSNLGSQLISESIEGGFGRNGDWERTFEGLREQLLALLKATIRPEFLNRVDEIIVFKPLAKQDIRTIVELQLRRVENLLAGQGLMLEVTDEAKDWLATTGYDPVYGARPLKRVIQKHLVNPLSQKILAGDFREGDTIRVKAESQGNLAFARKATAPVLT